MGGIVASINIFLSLLFSIFEATKILSFDIMFFGLFFYLIITPIVILVLCIWVFVRAVRGIRDKKENKTIAYINLVLSIFIVVVLVIFYILLYDYATIFTPRCSNPPYLYLNSTDFKVTGSEEAKSILEEYILQKNPDSVTSFEVPELRDVLISDKNGFALKKDAWVFDEFDFAVDSEGNIYHQMGCY